jgi:hypothetical protein
MHGRAASRQGRLPATRRVYKESNNAKLQPAGIFYFIFHFEQNKNFLQG